MRNGGYISVQSNDKISKRINNREEYAAMGKQRYMAKNKLTTGTLSDLSTTVQAISISHKRGLSGRPSASHNFAELGAGLINDMPFSQRSNDLYMRRPNN